MKLKMTFALAALLTIGLSSAAAFADTVNFTLLNPKGALPVTGGTETFYATVSAPAANSAAVFLNGDGFNITAPITLNDSFFFSTFPISLAPGASFTGSLFSLTAPAGTLFGTYLGSFTLLGGSNGNSSSTLGTATFSVATTPEPSSIVLLLTGAAGLAVMFRWSATRGDARNWAR